MNQHALHGRRASLSQRRGKMHQWSWSRYIVMEILGIKWCSILQALIQSRAES
jgi:hypothetical protein